MLERTACNLTLFVYPGLGPSIASLKHRALPTQLATFGSAANRRAFTSEWPVLTRLLTACRITSEPTLADAYVVPATLGTAIASRWSSRAIFRPVQYDRSLQQLSPMLINETLPHLTWRTAKRHIFLCSVDSQFLPIGGGDRSWPPGPEQHAVWIHLGDDQFTLFRSMPSPRSPASAHGFPIPNGLTVPYRISHWLPYGFPPPSPTRRLLLFASVNGRKHVTRRLLVDALRNQSRRLGLDRQVVLDTSHEMLTVRTAAGAAMRSVFCLCPTGDSKGFTARLYFSLAHGCLPVRVDGFRRALPWSDLALPFPSSIDWRRALLDSTVDEVLSGSLLARLLQLRASGDATARSHYVRQVAHIIVFDRRSGEFDAADATLRELQRRLRPSKK